jgi:hypothetical protein
MALTEFSNAFSKTRMPTVPPHQAEHPSLEVLAFAYDDHVNVGRAVGLTATVAYQAAVAKS